MAAEVELKHSASEQGDGEEGGDSSLPILTEVFRPFLEKSFRLNEEFFAHLVSSFTIDVEKKQELKTVAQLLDHLAESNKPGTYAAFIDALRQIGSGTGSESFKYLADYIEGVADQSKCRDYIKKILQVYCVRFCDVNPQPLLPYIQDIITGEQENVIQAAVIRGATAGAMELFLILSMKGMNCLRQLIIGLKATNHKKLADELSDCISGIDDGTCTCENQPSKLDDTTDDDTGTMVGPRVAYTESTPSEDNASGCDSLSMETQGSTEGEPNLKSAPDSVTSKDINLNSSQDEKSLKSVKELPSQRVHAPKQDDVPQDSKEDSSPEETPAAAEAPPEIIPIELRGYQEELVAAALQGQNSVIVAPTGSGKTVVAARVTKAVLDREPGVGQRTGNAYPPKLVTEGSNKVIFIVNKVPLVKQQCDLFKKYVDGNRILGLSGEVGHIGSLVDLLEQKDVLVMTAQILVNALQANDREDNQNRMELSKIGLLILDECHHCQKGDPYNEIMAEYCSLKLSSPRKERPQVLGLTASMGVGKAKTRYKAQTHIMKLCANLDAEKLCTVQDKDHLEELRRNRDKPTEEILAVPGRRDNSFKREIEAIMAKIEDIIAETPDGEIIRRECSDLKCPPSRGTQVYEQWLVRMQDYIAGEVEDNDVRMRLVTCVDHLKEYNNSLYINRDARTRDALDHLQKNLARHPEQDQAMDSFERLILDLFRAKKDRLTEISNNPANKNPLLDRLSKTLIEALKGKEDSRGILFCRTRAATEALLAWMAETPELKFLKPGRLIGSGGTGMTQKQQTELLSYFRGGDHQLIVATSVAEEGLDIKQCNVVIRYNYISNDIGRVQAQGRNRAKDGKFYLIVSEELKLHEREFMNQIREKMMFEATQNLQKMTKDDFLEQIAMFQKESKLERKLKKSNSHLLKPNKKLMKVLLICRKCGAEACTADDIKCIQNAHHIVLSDTFASRCRFVDMPHSTPCADMEVRQKIFCGNQEKSCIQEWGTQMLYKGCIVNLISPKHFVMKMPKGPARKFKKWKDVPFQIGALSIEELDKICNSLDGDGDDDEDEDTEEEGEGQEAAAEAEEQPEDTAAQRGAGDGEETVTTVTSFQPHNERASS